MSKFGCGKSCYNKRKQFVLFVSLGNIQIFSTNSSEIFISVSRNVRIHLKEATFEKQRSLAERALGWGLRKAVSLGGFGVSHLISASQFPLSL